MRHPVKVSAISVKKSDELMGKKSYRENNAELVYGFYVLIR
jgi:hypothetical protein